MCGADIKVIYKRVWDTMHIYFGIFIWDEQSNILCMFWFYVTEISEPCLPAPESLIAQFTARPVFIVGDVDDDRLSAAYWLATPPLDDQDTEMEQVLYIIMYYYCYFYIIINNNTTFYKNIFIYYFCKLHVSICLLYTSTSLRFSKWSLKVFLMTMRSSK